ncbi:MAG: PAC2 family protein [bacterium]
MKIYKKINIKEPIILAVWPGMGNVGLLAMDYIRESLNAILFAEIEMEEFEVLEAIIVEKGISKLPLFSKNVFYFSKKYNLVIFESESQIEGIGGIKIINEILNFAQKVKAKMIFTGAAFPLLTEYKNQVEIYGVVNENSLCDFLNHYNIKKMEDGQISGLNGLLLGYAQKNEIDAICLLSTIPLYAINLSNPRASKKMVEQLATILNIKIDYTKLDILIVEMDKKMEMIESKIKTMFAPMQENLEINTIQDKVQDKIPDHIIEKIENLFKESEKDKKKAYLLKKELDRWNLYKLYEDKFLDLFKKPH